MKKTMLLLQLVIFLFASNLCAGYNLSQSKANPVRAYVASGKEGHEVDSVGQLIRRDEISKIARDRMRNLDKYCSKSIEASFPIYRKKDGKGNWQYYPKDGVTDSSSTSVFMDYSEKDVDGGELVAIVHNHPLDKNGVDLSVGDAVVAMKKNVRVYAGSCKRGISPDNRGLVYVNPTDGSVMSVRGLKTPPLKSQPGYCIVDGHIYPGVQIGDDDCIRVRKDFKVKESVTDKEFEDRFARMSYHPSYFGELRKYVEAWKSRQRPSGMNAQPALVGNADEQGTPSTFDKSDTNVSDEKSVDSASEDDKMADFKMPDLSKLVDLFKQTMEQLRKINAKNSKPSDKDFKDHNMLVGEVCIEYRKIGDEVRKMHLSEQERIRMGEELDRLWGEKIKQYCKTIEELRKQIEAKGYGHFEINFNFDPKSFK